jgi:hypothetical protein
MPPILLQAPVELLPVIELSPWLLRDDLPDEPPDWTAGLEHPQHAWWQHLMAEAGLAHIPSLARTHFVAVRDLRRPRDLRHILQRFFEHNVQPPDAMDPEEAAAFSGGYALIGAGVPHLIPQCCGDLSDLDEWQSLLEDRSPRWEELWIGHPWVNARWRDAYLAISGFHEEGVQPVEQLLVPGDLLAAAVERAEEESAAFHERILHCVAEFFESEDPVLVADILTARGDE